MGMKIIGHRGARGLAPENTIAGLQKALEHHVDMIEFDVRVTKDGVPVLHHDSDLIDPDGSRHKIENCDYSALKEHKPDLATFEEALETVGKNVALYVEVKPDVATKPLINIIKNYYGRGWNNLFLGSKSQRTLLELQTALPDVPKIVIEPWSGVRAHRRARQLGTDMVSMNQLWLWWGFITPVTRSGWKLYAYTINDPKKAKRWAKYGLYGVVTDYPDLFDKMKS